MNTLPIMQVMPELKTILAASSSAVLIAEPGAGKTTMTPLALLDEPWMKGRTMLMLEPRRLAARAAAVYMASCLGEQAGQTVGYRMRMDSKTGPETRIIVVTEGVLTRMLQDDPSLGDTGLVIFDEFHERSLNADLGLALSLETQAVLREDLKLLVMSATLNGEKVSALLGGAPVVRCPGRVFPVETVYAPPAAATPLEKAAGTAVRRALAEQPGDILLFLPGEREIRRVESELRSGTLPGNVALRPLYGRLPQAEQDSAVAPAVEGRRKVVLATSIAETSLTIEGVRTVIDSGLRRTQRFSPRTGMPRLETLPISKASAEQRRGRAGRTAPGVCYRLWSREAHDRLPESDAPEILEADLAGLALELALWGARDPARLAWLDAPPPAPYAQATALLRRLGALDAAGAVTPHGRRMAALGAHPRAAHMLLRAAGLGAAPLACRLAALLQERDPLRGPASGGCDLTLRVEALLRYEASAGRDTGGGDPAALRAAARASHALEAQLRSAAPLSAADGAADTSLCGLLLSFAYPDRIGQRRGAGAFLLSGGRGAAMGENQHLAREPYIVAVSVDDKGTQSRIMLAAAVEEKDLLEHHADLMTELAEVYWDDDSKSVKARRKAMLGELTLKESGHERPSPEEAARVLMGVVSGEGLSQLPWDKGTLQLRERLAFMHRIDPAWPDVSDDGLTGSMEEWLLPFLHGCRSLREVQRLPLREALESMLDWERKRRLDQDAPTHIAVPSGSRIAVDYSNPAAPVLAVKLQEMFGQRETPRIGNGRVPVLLHLLSPARRPVQVTADLASFWSNAYFEVKKDLKGRYPKHYWPEDPLQAIPTRRTRPVK
ncbi:ATP-dependent helicase HrpB [Paenibacillus forsythiae]|uniref:ATP-dependent helicase HrpB n=3 Tax=Paenibacillus forsythiae TaxID=365616 RepID=A0ABU3H6A0_9BACL|nr:ATP-dependent helicase HrpB [Paenibacillus forsythiae]MDT3426342.1 ATP-dependent helicase HrpB [Paenibacillus forsythiae]